MEKLLVQELPCYSSALLCPPQLPRAPSLCVCSPMGVWKSEAGSVWREAWIILPWPGGDCADLHARMRVSSRGDDASLHAQN